MRKSKNRGALFFVVSLLLLTIGLLSPETQMAQYTFGI